MSDLQQRGETAKTVVVSVIIPVRNAERTLARALDSLFGQSFDGGVEVIVINNGSTDASADIARGYGTRLILIDAPHAALTEARNLGIAAARGEYLAFLDADDEWMPEKLARMMPLFEDDPQCVLAYHDAIEVDNKGRVIKQSYYPLGHTAAPAMKDLLSGHWRGLPILPTNVVMRREVAMRAGGFRNGLSGLEDAGMWILAREQGPFRYLPQALARREWEPSNRREDWYISGGRGLYEMLRPRYGRRAAAATFISILNWAGTMAMLRGERSVARKRYIASLRLQPVRPKTWIRLCATLLPARLTKIGEQARRQRIYGSSDRTITAASNGPSE